MDLLKRLTDPVYCTTRMIVGLMFACHGGQKILHFPPGGYPATEAWGYWGGGIELVCGFLIAFGLLTRLAAFIASGEMAVAYFIGHFPKSFWPLENAGEPAVLLCFIFLYMATQGSGIWSIDPARGSASGMTKNFVNGGSEKRS